MKRMKKIGLGIGILLILCLIAAVLAPFLIDLDRYKETILARAKPFVPRQMDFEHVGLTVLGGLGFELQGLRVAENPAFGTGNFLELDDLEIKLAILPLLTKQIRVKKIILKGPVVYVRRNDKGEWSVMDLIASGGNGDPEAQAAGQGKATAGAGMLAGLMVKRISIQDGKVLYEDRFLFSEGAPLAVEDLDVDIVDLSLDQPVSVKVAAGLIGSDRQNLRVTGKIGPVGEDLQVSRIPFSIRASLDDLDVGSVVNRMKRPLPVTIRSGRATLNWQATGSLDQTISTQSELDLRDFLLELPGAGEEHGGKSPLRCRLDQKLILEVSQERAVLESVEITANGNQVRIEGTVEDLMSGPKWDLKVQSKGFRPYLLEPLLSVLGVRIPEELSIRGPMEMELASAGRVQDLKMDARVDMGDLEIRYGDLFHKEAGTDFSISVHGSRKGERIELNDLTIILSNLAARVSGEAFLEDVLRFGFLLQTNPVVLGGWEALLPVIAPYGLEGSFSLRSSVRGTPENVSVHIQASSDRIGFRLTGSGGKDEASTVAGSGHLESCNIKIQAKRRPGGISGLIQAEIRKGEVLQVPFQRLVAGVRFRPDVYEVTGFEVTVFQGGVQGRGRYELARKRWRVEPKMRGLEIGALLDTLTEYRNVFSGTFRGAFEAQGTIQDQGESAIEARGSFRISEGEIKNFNLVGSLLQSLFGLKQVPSRARSRYGKLKEHEATRFDWLEGGFEMKDGVLVLENVRLHNIGTSKGTDSDAVLDGKILVDSQRLDLRGKVLLSRRHSRELAREVEFFRALTNPEGRIVLPFTVKGTAQKPIPFLDTKYVLGAVSRYYTRQGVDKLREQLGIPKKESDGGERPGEKLLRELFRKR